MVYKQSLVQPGDNRLKSKYVHKNNVHDVTRDQCVYGGCGRVTRSLTPIRRVEVAM